MKYLIGKCPIRLSSLFELTCIYVGCFFLAGFLAYLEQASSVSYVLMRYLRFIVEQQTVFMLCISTVAVVYHYQGIRKAETEIRCRIIVGDRLPLICIRYCCWCLGVLISCFLMALAIHMAANFRATNSFCLFGILATYIGVSSLLLGVKRAK